MKEKILLSWSGGKDSAMTLYDLQKHGSYEVAALVTTVTEEYERISMHGVRTALLEKQAQSLGIPLYPVYIPKNATNEQYEAQMRKALVHYRGQNIRTVAFGDLFLQEIKNYRERQLASLEMQGLFPIWKRDTGQVLMQFIELGFKGVICCVDPRQLDRSFAGREIDFYFARDLPGSVDPCGENGEFHSFVYDGPIFKNSINLSVGDVVECFQHYVTHSLANCSQAVVASSFRNSVFSAKTLVTYSLANCSQADSLSRSFRNRTGFFCFLRFDPKRYRYVVKLSGFQEIEQPPYRST